MQKIKIDKIIKSKRKSFGLEIGSEGSLIVRAPKRASRKTIQEVVDGKRSWILEKQRLAKLRFKKRKPKNFVEGESFLFLGHPYKLLLTDVPDSPLTLVPDSPLTLKDRNFILAKEYHEYARELFIAWYKEQAYNKISERVTLYSLYSGINYQRVKISNAQNRWGSCSEKGNLNFTWRLIMAPIKAIDYIVVHELAHLEEMNHSSRFWARVKDIMPDYEKHERWLKENNESLSF